MIDATRLPTPVSPAAPHRVALVAWVLGALLVAGCEASPSTAPAGDAVAQPDRGAADASQLDAAPLDAAQLDATQPDATQFDATQFDATGPDARATDASTTDAGAPDASAEQIARLARGRALYDRYCGFCHGANGEGYAADAANALNHPQFLATATDAFLVAAVVHGRPGTAMSGWGEALGGPLDDEGVADVVALMRSWQSTPSIPVDDVVVAGVSTRGEAVYAARCARCHGAEGQGTDALSLNNTWFLATASDGYLRHAIEHGRPDVGMPSYGGSIAPQAIDDLVALIRSWARPPGEPPPSPPELELENAVLNPGGPEPDFDLRDDRFVGVDAAHAAWRDGAALVFLDARAPADFAISRLPGAVSVPFYRVEEAVDRLPRDVWIVAYCGCPHAVSGQAYDALAAAGFTRIAVLDEGIYEWAARGYPLAE